MSVDFTQPFFWLKIILGILLFLYSIFAFVMFNQTRSMEKLVNQAPISILLEIIAFLHFAAAVSLFFFAIAIL